MILILEINYQFNFDETNYIGKLLKIFIFRELNVGFTIMEN